MTTDHARKIHSKSAPKHWVANGKQQQRNKIFWTPVCCFVRSFFLIFLLLEWFDLFDVPLLSMCFWAYVGWACLQMLAQRKNMAEQRKLGSFFFGNWIKGHEKIKREENKHTWMSLCVGLVVRWPAGFGYEFLNLLKVKTRKNLSIYRQHVWEKNRLKIRQNKYNIQYKGEENWKKERVHCTLYMVQWIISTQ